MYRDTDVSRYGCISIRMYLPAPPVDTPARGPCPYLRPATPRQTRRYSVSSLLEGTGNSMTIYVTILLYHTNSTILHIQIRSIKISPQGFTALPVSRYISISIHPYKDTSVSRYIRIKIHPYQTLKVSYMI